MPVLVVAAPSGPAGGLTQAKCSDSESRVTHHGHSVVLQLVQSPESRGPAQLPQPPGDRLGGCVFHLHNEAGEGRRRPRGPKPGVGREGCTKGPRKARVSYQGHFRKWRPSCSGPAPVRRSIEEVKGTSVSSAGGLGSAASESACAARRLRSGKARSGGTRKSETDTARSEAAASGPHQPRRVRRVRARRFGGQL